MFLHWLDTAQAGEKITYLVGVNLGDADQDTKETAEARATPAAPS